MNKRIVFMGTTEFSLKILKTLVDNDFNIVAVYTRAPQPAGRKYKICKTVVHTYAETCNIPVYTPSSLRSTEAVEEFRSLRPDVAVVVAYGLIIPQTVLDIPRYGCLNIHASLLPRWRGASPIQSAILAGDSETGITIMKMDAGIDTGDIVSMQNVKIGNNTNAEQLSLQLSSIGADMIVHTLNNLEASLNSACKQPEEGAIYAKKITKDFCKIDWDCSKEEIHRKIMALSPVPSAWTEISGVRFKIHDANIWEHDCDKSCGTVFRTETKDMAIACKNGAVVIKILQPAGKKMMTGDSFLLGHKELL